MWTLLVLLVASAIGTMGASPLRPSPSAGECSAQSGAVSFCLYRSIAPSAGLVASCRDERDCRVGYYYGNPTDAVWFAPPAGMTTLPRPEVFWLTATLAQIRFDCGLHCTVSYFFEVRRHRLSEPRYAVLATDPRRLLIAVAEPHALVVRQLYSGREVLKVERDWAPAVSVADVVTALTFDPDGRLSFTWLRGTERVPVTERVSVPSVPHS